MKITDIKTVAVLGAGTMGPGIAQCYAAHGYEVFLYSRKQETLNKARSVIQTNLKTLADAGLMNHEKIETIIASVRFTDSLSKAAQDAQFIVETVFEDKNVKREVYQEIDRVCQSSTIIASNTSYLNIFEVMVPARMKNTIIAHWFAPPHIIPLVEVIKGDKTAQSVVDLTFALHKKIGKQPIILNKFVPGFLINRIQRSIGKEVFYLLDNDYINAEQLDWAVKSSLAPRMMVLGLVQRYDFAGLELSVKNLKNEDYVEPPFNNAPKSLLEKVDRGEFGVKSGKGFYDYQGRPMEEVLRERDLNLIKVLRDMGMF